MPQGEMILRIWDVEHGACAMLHHLQNGMAGRLAMIDSGHKATWRPSTYIRNGLGRTHLDYLFITNADQDHMSDLQGLWDANISVGTLFTNRTYTADQIQRIKLESGPLTRDAARYVSLCKTFTHPVTEPFNDYMGGIACYNFFNSYPSFTDTNNLSLVIFLEFAGFKILFPGDLEKAGWRALLTDPSFCRHLRDTDILVASHHGRENGFCDEVFEHFTPRAAVVSDKAKVHQTQETVPDYRRVVSDQGVPVSTTMKRRHVLTTRRDGWIQFRIDSQGSFTIETEKQG